MEQIILHLIGDYVTQNNWMAKNKTTRWLPALLHARVYSVPFLIIGSFYAFIVILFTHAFIDRFRLIKYILRAREWRWDTEWGFITDGEKATPPYMWVWLMIIADNTLHLSINYLSLKYL